MRITRSKKGCFNCRKRKKKCSEEKPQCSSCARLCVECIWPKNNEVLPKDFKFPEADTRLRRKRKLSNFIHYDTNTFSFDKLYTISVRCSGIFINADPKSFVDLTEGYYEAQYTDEHGNSVEEDLEDIYTPSLSTRKVSTDCITDEGFLTVSKNFLQNSGPQVTHRTLSTTTAFGKFGDNKILREVLISCGCIYLSPVIESMDLTTMSTTKYSKCSKLLHEYIEKNKNTDYYNQNWVVSAYHLTYIISKLILNDNNAIAKNLQNTFGLLKKRYNLKFRYGCYIDEAHRTEVLMVEELNAKITGISSTLMSFANYNNSYHNICHIDSSPNENENLKISQLTDPLLLENDVNLNFNKTFLESFIYQYSIAILSIQNLADLPSNPFTLFEKFCSFLQTPIFKNDILWMNNPILGVTLDVYEFVAKASYLCRLLTIEVENSLSKNNTCDTNFVDKTLFIKQKAKVLMNSLKSLPIITEFDVPLEVELTDPIKEAYLKDSIIVREAIQIACEILLTKIINMDLKPEDEFIQARTKTVISYLSKLSNSTTVKTISTWVMLIVGPCCIYRDQKNSIIRHCNDITGINHGYNSINSIKTALFISWKDQSVISNIDKYGSSGIDILFDRSILNKVII